MDRPYTVLDLEPDADQETVRSAYRSLLKEHHPDQGGSMDAFLRVKRAYEAIQSQQERATTTQPASSKTATTDGGATTRTQNVNWRLANDGTEQERSRAESTPCCAGVGLEIDGTHLTLTLVSMVRETELTGITWTMDDSDPDRPLAWFTVENTSDQTLRWRGSQRTEFVGTDGERYGPAGAYRASDTVLPADWRGSTVDLTPGQAVRAVVVGEEIPDDAEIDRITYEQPLGTHMSSAGRTESEQFVFDIDSTARSQLAERPF
ncbi:J domain-containing protein [Natranaeroarchaeum sulfidigenes]|uniref:DnaJ-class molecular chaperone n=1 Tax=Natranaeroarchaeum sulfidigenes TaxID=2784880 RepID=A0A897MWL8_9EURY|nr:J domain-containing protein [Natranaeroarchaeum sulfidigenes]QSG02556.1 DnaJ-class molecular chaperone [Natranaeroarchaeum sulfidigenes]